jgi:TrmH family RNA methyltransferase
MSRVPLPLELERLSVVMVAPRNPLNIGAAARSMSNFGFGDLRLVNPYSIAFREVRSAVGASELMATTKEYENVAAAVADCSLVIGTTAVGSREIQHPVYSLPEAAAHIRQRLPCGRVALLFGSEKRGLSNDDLSHCHWLLRIPTRSEHRSMNLGQAVAVCLYELAREPVAIISAPAADADAGAGPTERLLEVLLETLHSSGYTSPDRAPLTKEKLRRMIRRLHFSAADAELLLGMLRKILWRLEHPDGPPRS